MHRPSVILSLSINPVILLFRESPGPRPPSGKPPPPVNICLLEMISFCCLQLMGQAVIFRSHSTSTMKQACRALVNPT